MFGAELPVERSARWNILDRFLGQWWQAPPAGQGGVSALDLTRAEKRLGLVLPPAFCEWYACCGARQDVWSVQDSLFTPRELRLDRDVLLFAAENRGVVGWGIRLEDLGADDPPVVVSDHKGGHTWFIESPTTSGFALQFAVLNVKRSPGARYSANGQAVIDALLAIDDSYPRLPFPELHWPSWPTRLYGDDDIVIETQAETWIWASARSREALSRVDALVRRAGMNAWESYLD